MTYKVIAKHKITGVAAPVMYVEADTPQQATKATRLNDFPDTWTVLVAEKK